MPVVRVASGDWVSPILRFRTTRLGRYLTVSSTLTALTVSSIRAASIYATVDGAFSIDRDCTEAVTNMSASSAAAMAGHTASTAPAQSA